MKKFLLFIGLISLGLNAQDIKGGIRIAPNMATFSSDVDNSSSGKVGYSIGYIETMNVNSQFALQGEISYTHISYEAKDSFMGQSEDKSTFSNNFLEIPIIAKYRINDDLAIGGGLQYCWGLGSSNDSGGLIDLSYDMDSIKIGARYYNGSKKIYSGNSLNNISLSIVYIMF
ncbi:outer membrane beta-barrel protein [Flavobacterium sp.]|jgi:hypothetical protein|uniref:outer membrane beta-barrel protein n=1 Tax=Flavobacterium sp. TaxID=239 RepID=UPI0037BF16D3